jgi:hypothetical protein
MCAGSPIAGTLSSSPSPPDHEFETDRRRGALNRTQPGIAIGEHGHAGLGMRTGLAEESRDGVSATRASLTNEREPGHVVVVTEHLTGDDFEGALGTRLSTFDIAAVQADDHLAGRCARNRRRQRVLVAFQSFADPQGAVTDRAGVRLSSGRPHFIKERRDVDGGAVLRIAPSRIRRRVPGRAPAVAKDPR